MKLKFKGFLYLKDKEWIFVFPSVVIQLNDPRYCEKTLLIAFHFLIWHWRWVWREERINEP